MMFAWKTGARRPAATLSALTTVVLASLLWAGTAHALTTTTKTAIPLKASGYRYLQVPWGAGAGFEAPAFDDTTWSSGQAGFGTSNYICAVNSPAYINTPWDLNTDMLVRKSFTLPSAASNVKITGTVDNDATVFLNGLQVGTATADYCATNTINVSATNAVAGTNLLAVRAHDRGSASYLDQSVTYDVPVYSQCLLYDPAKAAKLGSTIPLKFRLCDDNATNVSSPSITVHATSVAKQDNTASGTVEDAGNANPDADFRYDEALGGYIYNKTTKGLSSGTWKMTFTVDADSESSYFLLFDVK